MESIYLILLLVLFALAISDLIVGVSNDAVNFLNSAVGSKAGSFKLILLVAALGVFVGAIFSSGMMEIARKGIFNPEMFSFREVVFLFLAVMITDVILLDLFNTIGFPTSTTVSLIFELLGASVSVALFKITNHPGAVSDMSAYINSSSALKIISGILLSVVIAFTVGAVLQYIIRIIFTFDYEKRIKKYGAIYMGLAFSGIVYFLIIKGAKGASFMTEEIVSFIKSNTLLILLFNFIFWAFVSQLLIWFTRVNILKIIVFLGTFALAMAFAGNDLVNFIGVPMAGYESYKIWSSSAGIDPDFLMMSGLKGSIKTPSIFLILSGLVMVITLYTSRKAKTVIQTSVDLGRQVEGDERFGTSFLAKAIVRISRNFSENAQLIIPAPVKSLIKRRFEQRTSAAALSADAPAFDLIRASVILVVSSMLIALGTSLKLPLSTTYVTFLVAMGASLSDKAWGRESAVYRITGVLSIIGGWFLTAFAAFTVSFLIAYLFNLTHFVGVVIMIIIAFLIVYRTHNIHRKKEKAKDLSERIKSEAESNLKGGIFENCTITISNSLAAVIKYYNQTIQALSKEDRRVLRQVVKSVDELNKETKTLKANITHTILQLQENELENGHYYVQMIDYLREIAHSLSFISNPAFNHVDNNHKPLTEIQIEELIHLTEMMTELFNFIQFLIKERKFTELDQIINMQHDLLEEIARLKKNQIKRIQKMESGTKNSMLFLELLSETKNLLLYTINLLKAQRDFLMK